MVVFEGESENRVALANKVGIKELPFRIRLKDFRVEYYKKPAYLHIQARDGQTWKIPVQINSELPLGADLGAVRIVRVFENFKIRIEENRRTAYDDAGPGYNPALEVQIREPDGETVTRYAFERFPGHSHPGDKLLLSYRRVDVRDYVSEVEVIENDKRVTEKKVEVNHPLNFGGYHFYQHDYDRQAHRYTVLEVVSDSGLNLVYAGYFMLCVGVLWRLWLRELPGVRAKLKSE